MRCNKVGAVFREIPLSGVQFVEQRLGLFQIERVEAFGEPAIDRSEKIAGSRPAEHDHDNQSCKSCDEK